MHEIISSVDILTAEGVLDCLHLQNDSVAQVLLAFLEQFSDLVPLSDHFFYLFLEESVMLMTMFTVTIDAETVQWGNKLINTANPMSPVFFHHTLLAALAIEGTGIVKTDILNGLMAVSFGLVAKVFSGLIWLLRTFSSECTIVEHWLRWKDR